MRTRVGSLVVLTAMAGWVTWSWRPEAPRHTDEGRTPSAEELAAEAGVDPRTLVVDFKDDVSADALAKNGVLEEPISKFSENDRLYWVRFASADEAARAAEKLRRDPTVESVDYEVKASLFPEEHNDVARNDLALIVEDAVALAPPGAASECATDAGAEHKGFPNDPCFAYQWHLRQIGLPDAWKLGQGDGVVVAVIDTGVTAVPDLAATPLTTGYNFVANNDNAADDHGHGTHVAGTIAQATNNKVGVAGVAWGAKIMPLKVLSASGSGSMAAISQAIRYAADNGAHVINMSLGGPFPVAPIRKAVEYAKAKGVTVVAAAGNDGKGRVSYPAKYPGVVAVAATQFDETTTFYSNWGKEIDIAAPGGNVRVDQNGDGKPDGVLQNTVVPGNIARNDYLWFMGTSMASPHVAGVAALVVGAGVKDPDAVEAVLQSTARKPQAANVKRFDDRYGAGLVDAGAALKKARVGAGASGVGLAAAAAFAGLAGLGRRRMRIGGGFAASLLVGAVATLWPAVAGNPLVWSAAIPLAAVAVLYGKDRLRPGVAGLAFGVAGALLFAGLAGIADVRWVPDFLDRVWLLANAGIAAALGAMVARK